MLIFVVQENIQKSRKVFIRFEVIGEAQGIFQIIKYDGFVDENITETKT